MKYVMSFFLSLLLILPMAGFAQTQSTKTQQLPKSEQHFLKSLAQEDMNEVHLANMAMQKSNNPQVKQYAQAILAADPSMAANTKTIADKYDVKIPSTVTMAPLKAESAKLQKASGPQFDKEYISYEAHRQQHDLNVVERAANNSKTPEIKTFAAGTVPAIKDAVAMAQKTQMKVGTQAGM